MSAVAQPKTGFAALAGAVVSAGMIAALLYLTPDTSSLPKPLQAEMLVYARPPQGPERLIAELPGSAQARWAPDDEVRFSVRQKGDAFVYLLGVDPAGGVQFYFPRGGVSNHLLGDGKLHTLGGALKVSDLHRSGPVRVIALFSSTPANPEELAQAARTAVGDRPLTEAAVQLSCVFSFDA